ncbi:MAG: hypothetical protein KBT47_09605, partial [Armatimonadetes bacterium]|nr:hypothetical protein [Candidatus Hippobium faecium]
MKKITLLFAVLFCLFSFVYGEGLERAPMSEEYLNSFADYNGGIKPVSRQFVQNYPETKAILPSSYSSVKAGFISPVRDQSPYGCCWAFSACASMEAA